MYIMSLSESRFIVMVQTRTVVQSYLFIVYLTNKSMMHVNFVNFKFKTKWNKSKNKTDMHAKIDKLNFVEKSNFESRTFGKSHAVSVLPTL